MHLNRMISKALLLLVALGAVFCCQAPAQTSTSSGGNVTTSWGYYSWQVDHGSVTTTLTTETGFSTSAGTVQIPVSIPAPTTVHEVHGNVAFAVWPASCGSGSIIAQVRDQNGNSIASVNLTGLSSSSTNMPISSILAGGLAITSLQLQTFTSQCGALTVSWSLVMN